MSLPRNERGQVVVFFALIFPVVMGIGAIVITIGNWYTHGKHLQTKADASVFAGGGVWGFPCAPDIDLRIENQARTYVGPHMKADGTPYVGTAFNPQLGGVGGTQIHAVLNGSDWYDDDSNPLPTEKNNPLNASICDAKTIDVKVTEDNSFPLFSLIPLFPDIKRKARVEIQEIAGLSGLLPIGVRVPRPLSAAAVFYNETPGVNYGEILDVRYLCEETGGFGGLPAGLSGWTTISLTNTQGPGGTSLCPSWADFSVGPVTGVLVATSFRPACGSGTPPAGPPCLEDNGWIGAQANSFCRQASGTVQCWDATGSGSTQNVQAGVQFIRGYPTGGAGSPPQIRKAYLAGSPLPCYSYFNSLSVSCTTPLQVEVDISAFTSPDPPPPGNTRPLEARDVQVRYRLVLEDLSSPCTYGSPCADLPPDNAGAIGTVGFTTTGSGLPLTPDSQRNAVAIRIRLRNASGGGLPGACSGPSFTASCEWFYTATSISPGVSPPPAQILAAPIQRSFSGSLDRTGSLKWTRLTADFDPCDTVPDAGLLETADAASVPAGRNCFYLEVGFEGGIAIDQDEPPLAFNLGSTGSQRALIDCDDAPMSNLSEEIQNGCGPQYGPHQFTYSPFCPNVNSINGLLSPHPAPWDSTNGWPPAGGTRCVITQTGSGNAIMQGFNQRLFGVNNSPVCPADDAPYKKGRNYWHDANNNFPYDPDGAGPLPPEFDYFTFAQDSRNHGNLLKVGEDPRLITLFFTPYDSFSSMGNEPFPIVGFGAFYVTGYGRTTGGGGSWQGGQPEDPCTDGNVPSPFNGLPFGVGNEPPPDLNLGANQTWVWGHFVNPVLLTGTSTPSGTLCNPGASFTPCVAVLVE